MQQLRGESERLKITKNPAEDLEVPLGRFRDPAEFHPVQYSFPQAYGIGYEGLHAGASAERHAQAKQLKAFLLFFEQILCNQLSQIANINQLFAVDQAVDRTYFTRNLRNNEFIRGSEELVANSLDDNRLQQLVESEPEYLDRRNRFLDHMLSRFAEDFTDFALIQFSLSNNRIQAQNDLINTKVSFLKSYPDDSRNRARALDYRALVTDENQAVLRRRIALLLGLDETDEKQIFIIEHLLLRPRFPGDVVMPVCLDPTCQTCQDVGPYSFQITVVMPGWARFTDQDLNWRHYADRIILMETPSHILVKTCWVGDERLEFDPCSPGLRPVVEILCQQGITDGEDKPNGTEIEQSLALIWTAFKTKFDDWMVGKELEFLELDKTVTELETFFENNDPFADVIDLVIINLDDLNQEILVKMAAYFAAAAVDGLQYTRLKMAWEDWIAAASDIDWCSDLPLKSSLEGLLLDFKMKKVYESEERLTLDTNEITLVKNCTCKLLEKFGQAYYERVTVKLGTPEDLPSLDLPIVIEEIFGEIFININSLCPGIYELSAEDRLAVVELFEKMYTNELMGVSRKLKRLIGLLSNVKSIYPPATLHDCDDGNDDNPVRLGSTALGGGL